SRWRSGGRRSGLVRFGERTQELASASSHVAAPAPMNCASSGVCGFAISVFEAPSTRLVGWVSFVNPAYELICPAS
ncbi:MAG TPA: hypothetical protein PLQ18_02505, partial [Plasticicumulans sp.]|nr:hypothetical protein [Plasticicumulans sp.]